MIYFSDERNVTLLLYICINLHNMQFYTPTILENRLTQKNKFNIMKYDHCVVNCFVCLMHNCTDLDNCEFYLCRRWYNENEIGFFSHAVLIYGCIMTSNLFFITINRALSCTFHFCWPGMFITFLLVDRRKGGEQKRFKWREIQIVPLP